GEAALLKILLVIVLRLIELFCGNDLHCNQLRIAVSSFESFLKCQRLNLLLKRMEEDRRAVLCTPIRPLTVDLNKIVVLPKDFQQLGIRDLGRIIVHLDSFCVAGPISADFFISRILGLSTDVADARRRYTQQLTERGLDSPKTTGS